MRTKSKVFTTTPQVLLFSGAIQDPQGDLEKHSIFKPVLKAAEFRKNILKASEQIKNPTL